MMIFEREFYQLPKLNNDQKSAYLNAEKQPFQIFLKFFLSSFTTSANNSHGDATSSVRGGVVISGLVTH